MKLRNILGLAGGAGILSFLGYRIYKGRQLANPYDPSNLPKSGPEATTRSYVPAATTETSVPLPTTNTAGATVEYWRNRLMEAANLDGKPFGKSTGLVGQLDWYAKVIYFNNSQQKQTARNMLLNLGMPRTASLF